MKIIGTTGDVFCTTREELAKKYFMGMDVYGKSNLGIVALLSDTQHILGNQNPDAMENYRQILNDIKCILIEDMKKAAGE